MGNVALVKASDLGLKVKAPVQAAEGAVKE